MISFVIPCYKSAQTIGKVVQEIEATMTGGMSTELTDGIPTAMTDREYEVILVNDCSPDNTYDVICKLAHADGHVKGISLSKNFGQHAAIMAGLSYASGDVVVCLDDDGQTPACEVGKLLAAIDSGSDVVYARYLHKRHSLFRNFGSFVNEKMLQLMLGKPKDLYVSSYFAARRFVVDEILRYDKNYPYLQGLVLRTTKRITNVDVNHRDREVGESGYSFGKLLTLWMNGFTAFSVTPLRVSTYCGCIFAIIGFLYGIYTMIRHFVVGTAPLGYASLMSALMFIGGMIMLMLGLVGEYIGRMYIGANHAPQYVIRDKTFGESTNNAGACS